MQVTYGSYTGNGTVGNEITVGFQPDFVLVKRYANTIGAVFRVTENATNESQAWAAAETVSTNYIRTFTTTGFTLGNASNVNTGSTTYYYVAIRDDGAGDFDTFSYTGNGADGLSYSSLSFLPNFLLIKANSAVNGIMRFACSSTTQLAVNSGSKSDAVVSLNSNGFTVNDGSVDGTNYVNVNSVAHYGAAFKEVPGISTVFQYAGNATVKESNQPMFQAGFILSKSETGHSPHFRTPSMVDGECMATDWTTDTNNILRTKDRGFELGSGTSNLTSNTYNAFALFDPTDQNIQGITSITGVSSITF